MDTCRSFKRVLAEPHYVSFWDTQDCYFGTNHPTTRLPVSSLFFSKTDFYNLSHCDCSLSSLLSMRLSPLFMCDNSHDNVVPILMVWYQEIEIRMLRYVWHWRLKMCFFKHWNGVKWQRIVWLFDYVSYAMVMYYFVRNYRIIVNDKKWKHW